MKLADGSECDEYTPIASKIALDPLSNGPIRNLRFTKVQEIQDAQKMSS